MGIQTSGRVQSWEMMLVSSACSEGRQGCAQRGRGQGQEQECKVDSNQRGSRDQNGMGELGRTRAPPQWCTVCITYLLPFLLQYLQPKKSTIPSRGGRGAAKIGGFGPNPNPFNAKETPNIPFLTVGKDVH